MTLVFTEKENRVQERREKKKEKEMKVSNRIDSLSEQNRRRKKNEEII
jgi:hypothetical protein